jgi:hypothetical protein
MNFLETLKTLCWWRAVQEAQRSTPDAPRPTPHAPTPPAPRICTPFRSGLLGLFDVSIESLEIEHEWPAIWLPAGPPAPQCRKCGCTKHSPCEEGCEWVEEDLCSACACEASK